jgi:hypothetical protein
MKKHIKRKVVYKRNPFKFGGSISGIAKPVVRTAVGLTTMSMTIGALNKIK